MELIKPRSQWQGSTGAVDSEISSDFRGCRVDEDRSALAFSKGVIGIHHPRRVAFFRGRSHCGQCRATADECIGCVNLLGQRKIRVGLRGVEFVCVNGLLDLGADRVQGATDRSDENERSNEDTGVEVQSSEELPEPPPVRWR